MALFPAGSGDRAGMIGISRVKNREKEPCVGKDAIRKELERRVKAQNRWKIVGKYVSGNVAVIKIELKFGYIEGSGVDRVVIWNIYEVTGDKIAVATLAGQRTDPQTARFIEWYGKQPKSQ